MRENSRGIRYLGAFYKASFKLQYIQKKNLSFFTCFYKKRYHFSLMVSSPGLTLQSIRDKQGLISLMKNKSINVTNHLKERDPKGIR
jgi:hypothetical protein